MVIGLVCCGFPLSGLLFVASYAAANRGGAYVHEYFWAATGLALATAAGLVALTVHKRRTAAIVTVVLAALLSLPKFLRAPQYFNFYDELAHWRATQALLEGDHLFDPNALNRIVVDYPGLHVTTAAVSALTGTSVFASGNVVVLAARIAGCLAVFLIGEWILGNAVAAFVAVCVFAANPAFGFFDAQYSYESLALPLVTVVLLLALTLSQSDGPVFVAAVVLALAVVVTHHSSSYLLAGLLVLAAAMSVRRQVSWQLVGLAVLTVVACATWLCTFARYTFTYIGPYVQSNLTSIPQFLGGTNKPRRLFGGFPVIPGYERIMSYLSVVVLFCLYCAGVWLLLRRRVAGHDRLGAWLAAALGVVYFVSLPLVALRGDQVAKRTWEFAFLGLAPVCAVALHRMSDRRFLRYAAPVVMLVVFVGSGVARSGEHIRFPGPYAPSADPRSMTPDVVAAARWLRAEYGPRQRVVGDRTMAATLGSYGEQVPVTYQEDGYPVWRIFQPDTLTPAAMAEVRESGARWIAVDMRAAGEFPLTGFYFDESEPGAYIDTKLTRPGLTKFDDGPFRRVYDNGHVVLYEVLAANGRFGES